jgi:hypothetical protein
MALTAADRARGGATRARQAKLTKSIRVVPLGEVPKLETLADAITASAWVYRMAASGGLDPSSARETNRAIGTFVGAVNKSDLLRRIRELEKQLDRYERERRDE